MNFKKLIKMVLVGAGIVFISLIAWILTDIAMNPGHTIETFKKGFNDGRQDGK